MPTESYILKNIYDKSHDVLEDNVVQCRAAYRRATSKGARCRRAGDRTRDLTNLVDEV